MVKELSGPHDTRLSQFIHFTELHWSPNKHGTYHDLCSKSCCVIDQSMITPMHYSTCSYESKGQVMSSARKRVCVFFPHHFSKREHALPFQLSLYATTVNYWNPFSHKCEDHFIMNTQLLLLSLKTIICIDFAVIWLVNLKIKNVVLESWVTLLKWELRFFTGLLYVTACKSVRKMAVYFK